MDVVLSEEELPPHLAEFFEEVPSAGNWRSKDYVNVPALLAESLRADGWFFRAEVALTKVAPMPESCRDRPTRATEKLYLFAKGARYFYDGESERQPHTGPPVEHFGRVLTPDLRDPPDGVRSPFLPVGDSRHYNPAGRNLWDWWDCEDSDLPPAVWPWRPEPQKKGSRHYATYPLWLPLRCIRLGTSARGACPACGAPWRRVVQRKNCEYGVGGGNTKYDPGRPDGFMMPGGGFGNGKTTTLGWQPSCKCPPHDPVPCAVLDPFAGTATTGVAARLLGRTFTGIELSSGYCEVARQRLAAAAPLDDAAFARTQPPPAAPGLFDEEQP